MWESVDTGWSRQELSEVELGDMRLERRMKKVAEELSSKPEAPINQASGDWASSKGAYRLFDNKKVTAEKILDPHRNKTIERLGGESIVLVIQDTTYLNYSTHEHATELGPIGDSRSDAQGLVMHSALAITTQGLPLGFLSQHIWARGGYQEDKLSRKQKSIELKESYKWVKTLRETYQSAPLHTQLVTVCDRESDIYEFFIEAERLKAPYIVRASWNRCLKGKEYSNLWEQLQAQSIAGYTEVEFPHRSVTELRKLSLEIRFAEVTFKPPQRRNVKKEERLAELKLCAVYVKEVSTSENPEPVEWMLLTNLPVQTLQEAQEKIHWYTRRWSIEVFHRILKSGCAVERCQLQTAEKLIKYLTLMSIVAWRIFWMTHIRRTDPKAPATKILTRNELRALPLLFKRQPPYPPQRVPTVEQVVVAIARLGGFLARKGDKNPGPTTIWRGWQRLADGATLLGALHAQ